MLKFKLFSEAIELQSSQVANQYPFVATITYAGKLSDGFVGGTEHIAGGPYRVLISAELLRKKIKALQGKAVFATESLNSHTHNFKIGTFSQAWVEAATLPDGTTALAAKASGLIIETDDNRELVEKIIEEARAEKLGFSYDIKDVKFDLKASTDSSTDQFVEVTDFEWRGATILDRGAAAYEETRLAASKSTPRKDDDMTPKELQDAITAGISPLQTSVDSLKTDVANVKGELAALKAERSQPPAPHKDDKGGISMKDFAASIVAAMTEGLKPVIEGQTKVLEALTANSEQKKTEGVRKSVRFTAADFTSKFRFSAEDSDLTTSEGCQNLIDKVNASEMPKEKKEQMLAVLGGQKRSLIRASWANNGGGN